MVKRLTAVLLVSTILLAGCSVNHKRIADKNHPKNYFEHYEKLTALWGTGKTDTLNVLELQPTDVIFVGGNRDRLGLPWTEVYAGIALGVILNFTDSGLYQVQNIKTYAYPEELDQAIADAMKIGAQLTKDLGKPHKVDTWNDWYEEEYNIEMDQKTPSYQDAAQMKAYLEAGLGGSIMYWDMTSVACDAVSTYLEKRNSNGGDRWEHYVRLWIDRDDDVITLHISY